MKVLVTGSSGLLGSELVAYFDERGAVVVGIDNNMRANFFGADGDTSWNLKRLLNETRRFTQHDVDVRDRVRLANLVRDEGPFELVVHCAAQPSHDLSARRPLDDFDVNAVGTMNLLEAVRTRSADAVFVLMSTNKVYGDAPNELEFVELEQRWDYARPEDRAGVSERMRIDVSRHSIFGASKVAADLMTQEYGRCFGLSTHCLRCGCLTGPNQSGVELHGFLSYLVKTQLQGHTYTINGYKGKQVRDNIHSLDCARAIEAICAKPGSAAVYNLGGGRANSCSILEAFERVEEMTGRRMRYEYVERNRDGDHVCYITDCSRFVSQHPGWSVTKSLDDILRELVLGWRRRIGT